MALRLEEHPFIADAEAPYRETLARIASVEEHAKDSIVFQEGSPADSLFLILEGQVSFIKRLPGAKDQYISQCNPGEMFGEVALFTDQPRSLTAICKTPSKIAKMPKAKMLEIMAGAPLPIQRILSNIIDHLHYTTNNYVKDVIKQEKMSLVGNMANTIFHDFKNPFTVIGLSMQILEKLHQDEKTQQICQRVNAQIDRMTSMANELSEFSQGDRKLELKKVNLKELIDKFKDLNFPLLDDKNLEFEFNVEAVDFEGEEQKLLRVLQNLIGNAIESLPGGQGKIQIEGKKEENTLHLKITDNGKGIPESIRDSLFEPFVTSGKTGGTGLGTAIVYTIIKAHGGEINFETKTGEGTTFHIKLPVKH